MCSKESIARGCYGSSLQWILYNIWCSFLHYVIWDNFHLNRINRRSGLSRWGYHFYFQEFLWELSTSALSSAILKLEANSRKVKIDPLKTVLLGWQTLTLSKRQSPIDITRQYRSRPPFLFLLSGEGTGEADPISGLGCWDRQGQCWSILGGVRRNPLPTWSFHLEGGSSCLS